HFPKAAVAGFLAAAFVFAQQAFVSLGKVTARKRAPPKKPDSSAGDLMQDHEIILRRTHPAYDPAEMMRGQARAPSLHVAESLPFFPKKRRQARAKPVQVRRAAASAQRAATVWPRNPKSSPVCR